MRQAEAMPANLKPVTPRQTSVTISSSCSGVSLPRYSFLVADGWQAIKIAGSLRTPRGVILDPEGHLLVVESGKGITAFNLSSSGCVISSKTLVPLSNLNHGIFLSPDGASLYASSLTTVWKWTYDPTMMSVTGTSTVVVNGMNNGGHPTRTITIPKNNPNLIVVSCGSNENLDLAAGSIATERAVIKVFDMSSVPSGGYNFVTGGYQAGYGLRNEVGIVFDGNNMQVFEMCNASYKSNKLVGSGASKIALTI
jgi:glucose/arabinose dehydrogenase